MSGVNTVIRNIIKRVERERLRVPIPPHKIAPGATNKTDTRVSKGKKCCVNDPCCCGSGKKHKHCCHSHND